MKKFSISNLRFSINGGFTLLLAVLFVSAFLALSLGLSNLIIGQIQLSGTGRDSQSAFFAADSGAECAVYWDRSSGSFSTSSPSTITCAGESRPVGGAPTSSFDLNFSNGSCVSVVVDKSSPSETIITSIGHSPCNGRKVERGLEVRY